MQMGEGERESRSAQVHYKNVQSPRGNMAEIVRLTLILTLSLSLPPASLLRCFCFAADVAVHSPCVGLNMLCGQEVDDVGNEKAALA